MTARADKPHLSREHMLDLLKQMIRIRRFEDKCAELYTQEKIRGFLHLYDGEEAVAEVYNDLGNLLLAFVMVFTYFGFSQFLIIWSGNLPSEITWYVRRLNGGWQWLALVVALFHFIGPFFTLLSRDLKRTPRRLARIAVWLLPMYCLHLYWNVVPAFAESGPAWHLTNLAALVALGGGWFAAYCWHANRCLAAGGTVDNSPLADAT